MKLLLCSINHRDYVKYRNVFSSNKEILIDNTVCYFEAGLRFNCIFYGSPVPIASGIGEYYGIGIDVSHAHQNEKQLNEYLWRSNDNPYLSRRQCLPKLGYFSETTNTAQRESTALGSKLTWLNTSKAPILFTLESNALRGKQRY